MLPNVTDRLGIGCAATPWPPRGCPSCNRCNRNQPKKSGEEEGEEGRMSRRSVTVTSVTTGQEGGFRSLCQLSRRVRGAACAADLLLIEVATHLRGPSQTALIDPSPQD